MFFISLYLCFGKFQIFQTINVITSTFMLWQILQNNKGWVFIRWLAVNTPHTYFTQQHYVEITWMWSFCLLYKPLLAQHIFSSFPLCSFVSCSQFNWIVPGLQSIFIWLSSYGKVRWVTITVKPKMTDKIQRYWRLIVLLIICFRWKKTTTTKCCMFSVYAQDLSVKLLK